MKFTKMQGAGNDFIIINNIEEKIPKEKFSTLAGTLCTRRTSIGADGMMFVDCAEKGGDYQMYFYNADGSLGEMCGNGARCIARYGYEKGLAGGLQRVETTAGLVIGRRKSKRMYEVRLNEITKFVQDLKVEIDGKQISCDYIELGNPGLPHAVVRLEENCEMTEEALRDLGRRLRENEAFPKGANVNFCRIIGENEVEELTYERGVEDFTLACGTGTGSVVAALTRRGLVSGENTRVHVPGGELFITLHIDPKTRKIAEIFLTGPTNIVAEGEIMDEDLKL